MSNSLLSIYKRANCPLWPMPSPLFMKNTRQKITIVFHDLIFSLEEGLKFENAIFNYFLVVNVLLGILNCSIDIFHSFFGLFCAVPVKKTRQK